MTPPTKAEEEWFSGGLSGVIHRFMNFVFRKVPLKQPLRRKEEPHQFRFISRQNSFILSPGNIFSWWWLVTKEQDYPSFVSFIALFAIKETFSVNSLSSRIWNWSGEKKRSSSDCNWGGLLILSWGGYLWPVVVLPAPLLLVVSIKTRDI